MQWLIVPVLGFVAVAFAASPAGAAVTKPLKGTVETVGVGISGIAVGNTLSGSVTFDDSGAFPDSFLVTDLSLTLPGGVSLGLADVQGTATVNVTNPLSGSLDALIGVPGSPYGVSDGLLFSGTLSTLGAGHFELLGDPFSTTFIASGTLTVTPIPAALPLLATALGAMAVMGRRRETTSDRVS